MFDLATIGKSTQPYPDRKSFVDSTITQSLQDGVITSDGRVLYIRKSQAFDIPDKTGWLPFGDIDPAHFGADYTGKVDSHFAFQNAVDYARGALVVCGDGTLQINKSVECTHDYQVIDLKNCTIDGTDFSSPKRTGAVFEFLGKEGPSLKLTNETRKGRFDLNVDSVEGIKGGDLISIKNEKINCISFIKDKTIVLDIPLTENHEIEENISVNIPIRHTSLKGGIIMGGGFQGKKNPSFGQCAIFINCFYTPGTFVNVTPIFKTK